MKYGVVRIGIFQKAKILSAIWYMSLIFARII